MVDDYIPVIPVKGGVSLAFSKNHGKDVWVVVLEKVYAKAYGGYLPIELGDAC